MSEAIPSLSGSLRMSWDSWMTPWEKTSFDLGLSSSRTLASPAQTREESCTGPSGTKGHLISLDEMGGGGDG